MKSVVVYWSMTGNTEAMANAIFEGMKDGGAEAELYNVSEITAEKVLAYDKIALGCAAMGDEVLEEDEFEPFFTELEKNISGKDIALFGSYGWGDGEWMVDWQERVRTSGAVLFQNEGLIINEYPDDDGIEKCREFGRGFVK